MMKLLAVLGSVAAAVSASPMPPAQVRNLDGVIVLEGADVQVARPDGAGGTLVSAVITEAVLSARERRSEEAANATAECANEDRTEIYETIKSAFASLEVAAAPADTSAGQISSVFFPYCPQGNPVCISNKSTDLRAVARGLIPSSAMPGVYYCHLTYDGDTHTAMAVVEDIEGANGAQLISCMLAPAIHSSDSTFTANVAIVEHDAHQIPFIEDVSNPLVTFFNDGPVIHDVYSSVASRGNQFLLRKELDTENVLQAWIKITDYTHPESIWANVTSGDAAIVKDGNITVEVANGTEYGTLSMVVEADWMSAFGVSGDLSDRPFTFTVTAWDAEGSTTVKSITIMLSLKGYVNVAGECTTDFKEEDVEYLGRLVDPQSKTSTLTDAMTWGDYMPIPGRGGNGYNKGGDIFDGKKKRWCQGGGCYRAQRNNPGGFEVRFAEPTVVRKVEWHCIKDSNADVNSGNRCYGNSYDLRLADMQCFEDNMWKTVQNLDKHVKGNWRPAEYAGDCQSTNWKFTVYSGKGGPDGKASGAKGGHPGNNNQIHMSEIDIIKACVDQCDAGENPAGCIYEV